MKKIRKIGGEDKMKTTELLRIICTGNRQEWDKEDNKINVMGAIGRTSSL